MTERISDELMEKVIIECFGVKEAGRNIDMFSDPRDDTDAAIEVLNLTTEHHGLKIETIRDYALDKSYWGVLKGKKRYPLIPISGQPFRYAVCALAVKVMGLEVSDE